MVHRCSPLHTRYNMTMQPNPDLTRIRDSAELYHACGSADTAVQAAAYRELWHYLYRIAFYMTTRQPDGPALAQDCAQRALLRIHQNRTACREPKAFRTWSRRIVTNMVIDDLRRRKRLLPLPDPGTSATKIPHESSPEASVLTDITAVSLRTLLNQAPISDRSRRVVIGRYLDDLPDETLASIETQLADSDVRPSHVQVTRAKNIAKLRDWPLLAQFLEETR